jgi:putative effector of murein hydrolase LrgA (UPF0299 family)
MLHVSLIGQDWLPISIALVLSTLLTVVVTAKVMVWLSPYPPANSTEPQSEEN